MSKIGKIILIITIVALLIYSYRITVNNENLKSKCGELKTQNISQASQIDKLKNQCELLLEDVETLKTDNAKLMEQWEKEKLKNTSRHVISRNVPRNNSRKTYMDYRTITNKNSQQYILQRKTDCYTTNTGLRKVNEYYCIAVGTHYSKNIGDKLIVHMENGESFKVIVADIKDDKHTDETNRQHRKDGSVIEFVVDTKKLPELVRKMGDVSYMNETFKGEIKAIIKED